MANQSPDKEKYLINIIQAMLKTWPGNRMVNLEELSENLGKELADFSEFLHKKQNNKRLFVAIPDESIEFRATGHGCGATRDSRRVS